LSKPHPSSSDKYFHSIWHGSCFSYQTLKRQPQLALPAKRFAAVAMPLFGALQLDAAAMFQEAFDEAVSLEKGQELENIRRLIKPKLGSPGIPLSCLRWAFKVAHGIAFYPIGTQVDIDTKGYAVFEPHPREAIADYVHLQMMYVSGETGEPSVETTGIIEDIVRQQVIEIVSFHLVSSTCTR
jgi:hypothetical protein